MQGTFSYKNTRGKTVTIVGVYVFRAHHDGNRYKVQIINGLEILGVLHSEAGPAYISYYDGCCQWYLDGFEYTKIQWLNKLGKL